MKEPNSYILFSAMGLELIGFITVAIILGKHMDQRMGWNNGALITCSLLGLGLWFYHLAMLLRKIENRNEVRRKKQE